MVVYAGIVMAQDLGLIIGSGLDYLGLTISSRSPIKTPFGPPSSPILTASFGRSRVACIARHGETQRIPPHAVNYRANLWSLHQHGVRRCLAINSVGAIAPGFEPGALAIPDQLIDYTWGREHSFYDGSTTNSIMSSSRSHSIPCSVDESRRLRRRSVVRFARGYVA